MSEIAKVPQQDAGSNAGVDAAALPPDALAYLDELAADIAAHGGFNGRSVIEVVAEAHARRMDFIDEIRAGRTARAQMAGRVLLSRVYADLVARSCAAKALAACESIAANEFVATARRDLGLDL